MITYSLATENKHDVVLARVLGVITVRVQKNGHNRAIAKLTSEQARTLGVHLQLMAEQENDE